MLERHLWDSVLRLQSRMGMQHWCVLRVYGFAHRCSDCSAFGGTQRRTYDCPVEHPERCAKLVAYCTANFGA